jgi:hypothetical protein
VVDAAAAAVLGVVALGCTTWVSVGTNLGGDVCMEKAVSSK